MCVLFDEAANKAPVPTLPNLLADRGGTGIAAVAQSLAQTRARQGEVGADAH